MHAGKNKNKQIHPCVRAGIEHVTQTQQLEAQGLQNQRSRCMMLFKPGHEITMFDEDVAAPMILHEA